MTDFGQAKRLVVKIGSGVMTLSGGDGLDVDRNTIFQLASQISSLVSDGLEVVVVSSGAVALGMEELEIINRPETMSRVQALAATGQGLLMQLWREAFERHHLRVGQVLLTHNDLADRQRFLNVRATLDSLIGYGVVPIVNENDTVMTDEITVGDNDNLATQVCKLVGGDILILLSTVDGLIDSDGQTVTLVNHDDDPQALVVSGQSSTGRGGMASKIEAAQAASRGGIRVFVANGKQRNVVKDILAGKQVGTRFEHYEQGLPSRKHWIAYTLKSKGNIHIDSGAEMAIRNKGASLLPIGITLVEGQFVVGDAVTIIGPNGDEVGRGLSKEESHTLGESAGLKGTPVVHRDDLVVW